MQKFTYSAISLFLILFFTSISMAQLPANCGSSSPRIAIAGDSWAQFMADDNSHNTMLKMYGHADKVAIAESFELCIGCIGSPGNDDYAVSGSEARQWADESNYTYLAALESALISNPTVDWVVLSIGGNDILAGKSGGGWYKDMDLDVPGSEAALFNQVKADTEYIMAGIWSVRPDIKIMISGYDYPNFNVSALYCGFYACSKREDLSRDPVNDLINDAEISAMMESVEGIRKTMADADPRIFYDNGMGLMHTFYGYDDGLYATIAPSLSMEPQGISPYASGGDPSTPTDRDNFRGVGLFGLIGSFAADPIHLDFEGYEYKIKNQMDEILFEDLRKNTNDNMTTIWSDGALDGYVDVIGNSTNNGGIRVGDDGGCCPWSSTTNDYRGILSFDTGALPDNAEITGASLYLIRSSENDNPFKKGDRNPILDIKNGHFGASSGLEVVDGTEAASASNVGCFHGEADADNHAVRIDISPAGLAQFNTTGTTQFRFYFDVADWSVEYVNFFDGGGVAAALPPDVIAEQNPPMYAYRTVKQIENDDGTITEIELEKGPEVERREGFVLQEKMKEMREDEEGNIIQSFIVLAALEHPGLAKHMQETYSAPAGGYAPFLDVAYVLVLPVELLDFNVEKRGETALLTWNTATEVNSSGFYIEHSTDEKNWQTLDFIAAVGNSETKNNYDYIHQNPVLGNNYYRLKMADNDGVSEYSEIRHLTFRNESPIVNIFPNPFKESLSFEADFAKAGYAQIQVVDVLGKVVFTQQLEVQKGLETYTLHHLHDLAKGNYLLQIVGDGQVFLGKVVRN